MRVKEWVVAEQVDLIKGALKSLIRSDTWVSWWSVGLLMSRWKLCGGRMSCTRTPRLDFVEVLE